MYNGNIHFVLNDVSIFGQDSWVTSELLTSSKLGILNEALGMFTYHKVLFHVVSHL